MKNINIWKIMIIGIGVLFVINIFWNRIPEKKATTDVRALSVMGSSVAVINVQGPISGETSVPIFKSLEKIGQTPSIKGVILSINSPGGTTGASEEIYNELMKLRKKGLKVISSIGDIGASGGYYIASASDLIVANASSLTGSIGVIISTMNVKQLTDKLGIKMTNVTSGNMKDMLSPFKDISPQDLVYVKGMIQQIYEQFINAIVAGRGSKIEKEKLLAIADGRILTGVDAYKSGLVDVIGGLTTAQDEMKKLLKDNKVKFVTLATSPLDNFLKILGAQTTSFSKEINIYELTQMFLKNHINTPLYFSSIGGGIA